MYCRYFCGPNAKKTAALAKQVTRRRKTGQAAQVCFCCCGFQR